MKILSEAYKVYREHPVFEALYGSLLEMNQSGEIPFNLVAAAVHKYDEVVVKAIESTSQCYAIKTGKGNPPTPSMAVYRYMENHWWFALKNVTVYSIPHPNYNITLKRKVKLHKKVVTVKLVKVWAYSPLGEKSPYEMVNIPGPRSNPYTIEVEVKRKEKKRKFVDEVKEVQGYNPLIHVMALGKGERIKKEGGGNAKDFTQPMPYNEKLKLAKSDEDFHDIAEAQEKIVDVVKGRYRKHSKPWPRITVKRCGTLKKPVDFEPLLKIEGRRERREKEVRKARKWVGREYMCLMDRQGRRLADLADEAGGILHLPGHNVVVEADKEVDESVYETRRKEKLGGLVVIVRQKRSKWQVHPVHTTPSSSSSESSDEDLDTFRESGMLNRWSFVSKEKNRRRNNRSNSCDPGFRIKEEEKALSFLDDLKTDVSQMETSQEVSRSTFGNSRDFSHVTNRTSHDTSHLTNRTSHDLSHVKDELNISFGMGRLDISGAGVRAADHQLWQPNMSHPEIEISIKNDIGEMLNLSPIPHPKFSSDHDLSFVDEAMSYDEIKAGSDKRIFDVDSLRPMPAMPIENLLYSCSNDYPLNPSTPKRVVENKTRSAINTPMPSPSYANLQESNLGPLPINTPKQSPIHSLSPKDTQGSPRKPAKSEKFIIEDDLLDFEWEGEKQSSSESEGCSPMRSPIKSPEISNMSPSVSSEPSSRSVATESSLPTPLFQLNFQSKPKIHSSNPFQRKPKIHPSNPFQIKPKIPPSNPFQSKPKIHPSNPFLKKPSPLNQPTKESGFPFTSQSTVGFENYDCGSLFSPLLNLHAAEDNPILSPSSIAIPEFPNFNPGYTPSNDFGDLSNLLNSSQTPVLDQSFKLDFLSFTNAEEKDK